MTTDLVLELFKQTMTLCLLLVSPILGVSMLVGLLISVLQAVTSLQEQTLVFAPKLIAAGLTTILLAPWMLRQLVEFFNRVYALLSVAAS